MLLLILAHIFFYNDLIDIAVIGACVTALVTIFKYVVRPIWRKIISPVLNKNIFTPIAYSVIDPETVIGYSVQESIHEQIHKAIDDQTMLISQKIDENTTKLDHVVKEASLNDGSSIKDAIKRIEMANEHLILTRDSDRAEYLSLLDSIQRSQQAMSEETRLRIRELTIGSNMPMIEWNAESGVISINNAYSELIGYTLQEVQEWGPNGLFKLIVPEEYAETKDIFQHYMESGDSIFGPIESHFKAKDGTIKCVRVTRTALHDKDGNIIGWLGTAIPCNNHGDVL
jgi:PAS domain S-box-containing protein